MLLEMVTLTVQLSLITTWYLCFFFIFFYRHLNLPASAPQPMACIRSTIAFISNQTVLYHILSFPICYLKVFAPLRMFYISEEKRHQTSLDFHISSDNKQQEPNQTYQWNRNIMLCICLFKKFGMAKPQSWPQSSGNAVEGPEANTSRQETHQHLRRASLFFLHKRLTPDTENNGSLTFASLRYVILDYFPT